MVAVSRALALILLALAASAPAGPAAAHLASDSYLGIELAGPGRIEGRWDIALRDLDVAVGLDADADGAITWGELRARRREIEEHAFSRLTLRTDAGECRVTPTELLADRHAGSGYAVLRFTAECGAAAGALSLEYRLLFDLDPTHRGLLTVVDGATVRSEILSPEHASVVLSVAAASLARELERFFLFGLGHILFGYDHLLFVAVLLAVASLRRVGRSAWAPVDGIGRVGLEAVKILTAFTLAHGLTMSLATVGPLQPPPRLIEAAVAATIVLAAADNIRRILPPLRWTVAFAFGLLHGLSFAAALAPTRLPPLRLALALGSFNLGVEAGQIALALLLVPIAYVARREPAYRAVVAPALSAIALLLGAAWFLDRVFLLDVLALPPLRP